MFNNYTQQEISIAKKRAFTYIYGSSSLVLGRPFRFDKRTRIGTLASYFVLENKLNDHAINAIKLKRKARKQGKAQQPANVLANPLFIDFKRNAPSAVYSDRLCFNGRNHWAKTTLDFKVLQILQKNFLSKSNKKF